MSRPGIEPGPAAWQARMLPLAPQRWTRGSGKPYLANVKIVPIKCTFPQELFIVGGWILHRLFMKYLAYLWWIICSINLLDGIHCRKYFFTQSFRSSIYSRLQVSFVWWISCSCMLCLNALMEQFTSKMGLHHNLPTFSHILSGTIPCKKDRKRITVYHMACQIIKPGFLLWGFVNDQVYRHQYVIWQIYKNLCCCQHCHTTDTS